MNPTWLDQKEYPFENKYLTLSGAKMHYIDEGAGSAIVFVHGTPSWSFEFRQIIRELSQTHRCIAADHIGFGLSDKPKDYAYTTEQHTENFEQFINSLNIEKFHLVMHDFGGPIGLHYAVKHPEKIASFVFCNTWCWSSEEDPSYLKMKRVLSSPLLPFLYRHFNLSAKYILPAAYGEKSRLTRSIHKQFTAPFSKPSERNGTVGFAKSLLNDQQWFENIWKRIEAVSNKPALLLWGMKDQFITERFLLRLEEKFTNHTTIRYEDAGHFVLEEKSFTAGPDILHFLSGL